jgi:hypothetical protein
VRSTLRAVPAKGPDLPTPFSDQTEPGKPRIDPASEGKKKADVVEYPEVFDHVGLLVDQPPGTAGLLFT